MDGLELLDRLEKLAENLENEAAMHQRASEERRSAYAKGLSHGWCDGKLAAVRRIRDELAVARAYQAVK